MQELSQLCDHTPSVDPLDQKGRHLKVPLPPDRFLHRIQDRPQTALADARIKRIVSLHVDVQGIDNRKDAVPRFLGEGTIGDHDIPDSVLLRQHGDVDHVVLPDTWLAVSIADAADMMPLGQSDHHLRGIIPARDVAPRLADREILAELAMVVATSLRNGKALGAGKKMVEGFLLDRIHGKGDQLSVVQRTDRPSLVPPDLAVPVPPLGNIAMAPTEIAVHLCSPKTSAWKVS